MSPQISYIERKVADRQKLVDDLRTQAAAIAQQLLVAEAELGAYMDVLAHIPVDNRISGASTRPATKKAGKRGRPSRMAATWQAMIKMGIERFPGSFTNNDVIAMAGAMGRNLGRQSLRAQLSNYVSNGWLERLEPGVFRSTPKGAAAAGYRWPAATNGTGGREASPNENGPPEGGPDTGSKDGSRPSAELDLNPVARTGT